MKSKRLRKAQKMLDAATPDEQQQNPADSMPPSLDGEDSAQDDGAFPVAKVGKRPSDAKIPICSYCGISAEEAALRKKGKGVGVLICKCCNARMTAIYRDPQTEWPPQGYKVLDKTQSEEFWKKLRAAGNTGSIRKVIQESLVIWKGSERKIGKQR